MSQKIRAFIALDISAEIRKELTLVQSQLKTKLNGEISWVKPDNIHITLRFLGDILEDDLEKIKGLIQAQTRGIQCVKISLGQLGVFASINNPRVIWVGLQDGLNEIKLVSRHLEEKLSSIGYEKEKQPFHPHLTLARIKFLKNKANLEHALKTIMPDNQISCLVDSLILYKSQLTPAGAIYTKISEAKFLP